MGRQGAAAAALMALGLLACARPPQGAPPPTPVSAADLATADARVRRLSSGNPAATPTPASTPAPRPTCAPDALWWSEARTHEGERVTLQGPVAAVRTVGPQTMLDLGQAAPDANRLEVRLPEGGGPPPSVGTSVCAVGAVTAGPPPVLVLSAELAVGS